MAIMKISSMATLLCFLMTLHIGVADTDAGTGTCDVTCNKYSEPETMQSAFYVSLDQHILQTDKQKRLIFDEVSINIGEHWDTKRSLFKCEIPGVYIFNLNIMKMGDCPSSTNVITISDQSLKDMKYDVSAYTHSEKYSTGSGTRIIKLKKNDVVMVTMTGGSCLFGSNVKYTNFSGYLLYPE